MFRTARIVFAEPGGPARTLTAQVWYVEGESQYWHDVAVDAAVGRNGYADFRIIEFAWLD